MKNLWKSSAIALFSIVVALTVYSLIVSVTHYENILLYIFTDLKKAILFLLGIIVMSILIPIFWSDIKKSIQLRAQLQKDAENNLDNIEQSKPQKTRIKLDVMDGLRFGFGFGVGMFLWGILAALTSGFIIYALLSTLLAGPIKEIKQTIRDPFGINTFKTPTIKTIPQSNNQIDFNKLPPEVQKYLK